MCVCFLCDHYSEKAEAVSKSLFTDKLKSFKACPDIGKKLCLLR